MVWQHQGSDVAKFQAADLHYIKAGGGGPNRAIGGPDLGGERIVRRMDAKSRGVVRGKRHNRRASIDHKVDTAAIDPAVDVKVPVGVARNNDRSQMRIRGVG